MPVLVNPLMSTSFSEELAIMPASVPVPSSIIATGAIRDRPETINWLHWRMRPISNAPTRPPSGNAINGSMAIPAIGRSDSRTMATKGALIAAAKPGRMPSACCVSSSAITLSPLSLKRRASR
ncbi:hypothetical protein D3C71_1796880 [compost metagenome]